MNDLTTDLDTQGTNPYLPMMPAARSALKRILLNSANEKLVKETAQDILDRGGETRKSETRPNTVVQIKDSQVQLLVKAAQEVTE